MGSGGSGIKCIKYLLFSFNLVFWLGGLAAVGIGIWIHVAPGSYNEFIGEFSFKIPASLLMAAGSAVMLTGLCGCLGAIRESKCLLGMYFTMLVLIFCAETAAGVLGFLFRNEVKSEITTQCAKIIKEKYGVGDHNLDHTVNSMQQNLKCCGADGPNDYVGSAWGKRTSLTGVPQSCCKNPSSSLCDGKSLIPTSDEIHATGCVSRLLTEIKDHMMYMAAAAVGIGGIQILGMIFSCCLFFRIDSE